MDFKDIFKNPGSAGSGFLSWAKFRDLAVILVCTAVAYRLAVSQVTIDLSGFGFTDLLSLILAISAIVLSAAFYFKADESSKSFYNNSYEFTKNISELLGRIEERFGAQLLSINKGYDELNNKLNVPIFDLNKVKEDQEKEKEVIRKNEVEIQELIDSLMEKAEMDDAQKAEMSAQMAKLKSEADHAKLELSKLELSKLGDPPAAKENIAHRISEKLHDFLSGFVGERFSGKDKLVSYSAIADRFGGLAMQGYVPTWVIAEMHSLGFISGGAVTLEGAEVLSRYISRFAQ
ncbi:hypothetical protein [Pseudomonas salomonii]|uniref:SMODS and SLOG-associating 2TM effector domain-containing protein n=1 Tax=Pseudomonas salomonii TaxID=191391 RepID=A0ABS9GH65_9PSED|nr:hypothetical protein [Pseudomonas salomonii]MCF5545098.1 hypothetical protein [Pseudomonas salomonii]